MRYIEYGTGNSETILLLPYGYPFLWKAEGRQ